MNERIIFSRSIYRSAKYQDLIQKYVHADFQIEKKSIFTTIKDLMFFVALLGYAEGKRIPFEENEKKDDIAAAQWINEKNIGIIFALALAVKSDSSVLKKENEDEMLKIFEEYSNGGFSILKQWQKVTDDVGIESIIQGLIDNNLLAG